jgi:hypothetical protein
MEGKDFYLEGNELVAGFSKPTRGRLLAAHGNAVGLIRYQT